MCSVYTSCLWLGALYAFIEMAKLLEKQEDVERFDAVLQKAKRSFEDKFLNGELPSLHSIFVTHNAAHDQYS